MMPVPTFPRRRPILAVGDSVLLGGQVNGALREAVRGRRHATVADWHDVSARPGAVVDGTHTSPNGARLLAALLARALRDPRLGGMTR